MRKTERLTEILVKYGFADDEYSAGKLIMRNRGAIDGDYSELLCIDTEVFPHQSVQFQFRNTVNFSQQDSDGIRGVD